MNNAVKDVEESTRDRKAVVSVSTDVPQTKFPCGFADYLLYVNVRPTFYFSSFLVRSQI